MTGRNILLFLHIAAAIIIIGGLAFMDMVVPGLVRGGRENLPALRKLHGVSRVFGPSAIVVLLLGLGLVLRRNSGFEFSQSWLGISMLLFIVAMVIGSVPMARIAQAAMAKMEQGQPADAEAGRLGMLGGINILILLVITYLMVAKPM